MIINYDFQSFIFNCQRANTKNLYVSIKLNVQNQLRAIGLIAKEQNEVFISTSSLCSLQEYLNILDRNLNSLQYLLVTDLKYFYRALNKEQLLQTTNLKYKLIDLLYLTATRNIDLDRDYSLRIDSAESKTAKFILDRYNYKRKLFELLPNHIVEKLLLIDLEYSSSIYTINSNSYTTINNYYYTTLDRFLITLALLEKNSLNIEKILLLYSIENIKKYFEYINNNHKAYIEYFYTHSNTMRINSSFSNLDRIKKNKLCSNFINGSIIEFDFNSFEIKALLDYFSIEDRSKDLYSNLSTLLDMDRDQIKDSLIKWFYGSTHYDKNITSRISWGPALEFNIQQELIKLQRSGKHYITTKTGSIIYYKTHEEACKKHINGLAQNYAQFVMMNLMIQLYQWLDSNHYSSKLIAINYDAFYIDATKEELDLMLTALPEFLEKISYEYFTVLFSVKATVF